MKVIKVIDIVTKDDQETFDIEELVGTEAPFAYHINYGCIGHAKFIIDKNSIDAFANNLSKIEDSYHRAHLYNLMFDMLKEGDMSGSQLLKICKSQLVGETQTNVLTDVLKSIIPVVIADFMPIELYEQSHKDMFELFLGILASGNITHKVTRELILEAILISAKDEGHIEQLINWFKTGFVHDLQGNNLNIEIPLQSKHKIMIKIWSS